MMLPQEKYFKFELDGTERVYVKRTQFSVLPSHVRVVQSAQREQWHATIADMARPPLMNKHVHWLENYVMLSRAFTTEGLLILRLPQREGMLHGASPYLLDEVDRLLVLEKAGSSRLREFLSNSTVLPAEIAELFDTDTAERQAQRQAAHPASRSTAATPNIVAAPVAGHPATTAASPGKSAVAMPEHNGTH